MSTPAPVPASHPYGIFGRMARHLDAFVNAVTGAGTSRDRAAWGFFADVPPIDPGELRAMFRNADIPRKIVRKLPQECQRQGFTLNAPAAALGARANALGLAGAMYHAHWSARLFGGAIVYVAAPGDSAAPFMGGGVTAFEAYDRTRLTIVDVDNRGMPTAYDVSPLSSTGTGRTLFRAHASRCIHFGGAETDDASRIANRRWDDSVLQCCYEALQGFGEADRATTSMLTEASQGIIKIAGLVAGLAGGQKSLLLDRLVALDQMRGNTRSLVFDADPKYGEDFKRAEVSFGGVPDLYTRKMQRVAAAAELPMALLFGNVSGGLNASDDNEMRAFYDSVAAYQRQYLEPKFRRALWAVDPILYGRGVEIHWLPLWQQSPKEAAETRAAQAGTDEIYEAMGAVTLQEIRASRFAVTGWSGETHVNQSIAVSAKPAPTAPAAPAGVPPASPQARPATPHAPGPAPGGGVP